MIPTLFTAPRQTLAALIGGFVLDIAIGDPNVPFHPVRLLGKVAALAEKRLRPRLPPFIAGAASWTIVVVVAAGSSALFIAGGKAVGAFFGFPNIGELVAASIVVWASIALRDLAVHAERVRKRLSAGDLEKSRIAVSRIVGRDTAAMDEAGVSTATVESIAESYVDGFAAPLFWALFFGPLGAAVYRAINTMDSMFGHKDDRYLLFGRLPAQADDAANFVPARLASLLTCLCARVVGGSIPQTFTVFRRDRLKHESPNAAHSEAAFAGALGIELGGRVSYAGIPLDKPHLGQGLRQPAINDILRAEKLLFTSAFLWILCTTGCAILFF